MRSTARAPTWRGAGHAAARARQVALHAPDAPAAGRIIRRDGEIGEYVPVNTVMFYHGRRAPLRITADVDEEDRAAGCAASAC
jgi:multidrug efflux system membrane fusion protein